MELEQEYLLSQYQEMGILDGNENVRLVRNILSGRIAVKKIMHIRQKPVYMFLKTHRNDYIPEIYHFFEDGTRLIVIEEYIEGRNLSDILNEYRFSEEEGCHILKEVCRALYPLHMAEEPVICRDLKPENIMLTLQNHVKLVDFDIARIANPEKNRDTVVMGTVGFASPEQFGGHQTDSRSDIYSLGMILNYLILGKSPVDGIVEGKTGDVIRRCIAVNPNERYQSVKSLELALEECCPSEKREIYAWKDKRVFVGNYASVQANECKEGKAWRKYLPPGFRTGIAWKMILAVTGYLTVMSLSFSMEIKEQEIVITGVRARTQQILFLMSQLLEIGFIFNYMGLRDTLPLLNSKNYLIRALGCVVLEFILLVIAALGCMLLDTLFW